MTKPGYTTSEFWLTLGQGIIAETVSVITAFHPSFREPASVNTIVPVAAQVAGLLGVGFYTHNRTKVKTATPVVVPVLTDK